MSLSIGNIGATGVATSYVATANYNYPVENKSQTSTAYAESVNRLSGVSIEAASPVQYPTATTAENNISHIEAAQKAERGFNAIASGFGEGTTSYDYSMAASAYGRTGSTIDLYA